MPECRNSLLCADDGKVVVISRASGRLDVRMHLQHFAALRHLPTHAPIVSCKLPCNILRPQAGPPCYAMHLTPSH